VIRNSAHFLSNWGQNWGQKAAALIGDAGGYPYDVLDAARFVSTQGRCFSPSSNAAHNGLTASTAGALLACRSLLARQVCCLFGLCGRAKELRVPWRTKQKNLPDRQFFGLKPPVFAGQPLASSQLSRSPRREAQGAALSCTARGDRSQRHSIDHRLGGLDHTARRARGNVSHVGRAPGRAGRRHRPLPNRPGRAATLARRLCATAIQLHARVVPAPVTK
jgi:hypothetical protein